MYILTLEDVSKILDSSSKLLDGITISKFSDFDLSLSSF